jgi:hypothetical protein
MRQFLESAIHHSADSVAFRVEEFAVAGLHGGTHEFDHSRVLQRVGDGSESLILYHVIQHD